MPYNAEQPYDTVLRRTRALVGAIVKLPGDWQGELDYTWDRSRGSYTRSFISAPAAALTAINNGTFNVFRDVNQYPVDVSQYFLPNSADFFAPSDTTLKDLALRVSGPVGTLPAGPVVLTGLLQTNKQELSDGQITSPTFQQYWPSRWQKVDSAYVETKLPLISPRNAVPAVQVLELTLAARHDRYETLGANTLSLTTTPVERAINKVDSTDPTVSLKFQPLRDVTFRGSYGTGFLPPAVNQLVSSGGISYPVSQLAQFAVEGLRDPLRGNEVVGAGQPVTIIRGGNADLKPEISESWSFGAVFTPRFISGLRLSVDWVQIDKTDNIRTGFTLPTAASGSGPNAFNYEAQIPGLIMRGAPSGGFSVGPVVAVNEGLVNIASQAVEAVDVAVDYTFDTDRFGSFTFSSIATRQLKNETKLFPTSPVVDNAGTQSGGLRWRGNATMEWNYRQWMAAWSSTYFDSYWANTAHTVDLTRGSAKVENQLYHDILARYRLDGLTASKWLSSAEIQLGIQNVLNRIPPVDPINMYDGLSDPRLRRYSISLRTQF